MKLVAALAMLAGCSAGPASPPDSTLTIVVNDTARTALGPFRRVASDHRCREGTLFESRTERAAMIVCVPHDPSGALHGHVSYYGEQGLVITSWHHAPLTDGEITMRRVDRQLYVRAHASVTARHAAQPASLTGSESVELEIVGEARLG